MKKTLKLDRLSSKELEKKQLNKVKGGYNICNCVCNCISVRAKFFTERDSIKYARVDGI